MSGSYGLFVFLSSPNTPPHAKKNKKNKKRVRFDEFYRGDVDAASCMGYTDAIHYKETGVLKAEKDWSISIAEDSTLVYTLATFQDVNVSKKCKEIKKGDVFRFRITFSNLWRNTCELFHNDKNLGKVFSGVPNEIIPTVGITSYKAPSKSHVYSSFRGNIRFAGGKRSKA